MALLLCLVFAGWVSCPKLERPISPSVCKDKILLGRNLPSYSAGCRTWVRIFKPMKLFSHG